jgi:hypothetical protein
MRPRVGLTAWLAAAAALGATDCAERREAVRPQEPGQAALALFRLAAAGREVPDELVAPAARGQARGRLDDAVADLAAAADPHVVAETRLPDGARVAVDVEARLGVAGRTRYTVVVERDDEGRWSVAWLQGPGLEWPPPRPRPDGGLGGADPVARGAGGSRHGVESEP